MGRYIQILFGLIAIVMVLIFNREEKVPLPKVEKNTLLIKKMTLKENVGDDGFYELTTDKAFIYDNYKVIDMDNCSLIFQDKDNILKIKSLKCKIYKDVKVEMFNKINGNFNEYSFVSGDEGYMVYFFDNETGFANGNLQISSNTSKVYSESVYFNKKLNVVEFKGAVEVEYEY